MGNPHLEEGIVKTLQGLQVLFPVTGMLFFQAYSGLSYSFSLEVPFYCRRGHPCALDHLTLGLRWGTVQKLLFTLYPAIAL